MFSSLENFRKSSSYLTLKTNIQVGYIRSLG
jgi:hypothetical protein